MEKVFTPKEVAEILRIHEATVKEFLREGKMKGFKAGNRWRIKESDLKEYMDGS